MLKNLGGEKKEKMKTKNKMFALLEIAIVLCSVFLVAIPGIAAEQTTQKVSASEVTTASEDDFVLGIYGNANEDDTIDMRDLTYVKLIFFGKKPETELADAKYDGKINPLDFIQIKLIIVGKEKELTLIDSVDRIVTVKKPVERIIPLCTFQLEHLRTLDAADRIVGVDSYLARAPEIYLGELCELPVVGKGTSPDYETILSLKPDLVMIGLGSYYDTAVDKLESADPNLPILRMDFFGAMHKYGASIDTLPCDVRKMGYVLDRREEAEEFIDWYYEIIEQITDRTDTLSDDEKPRVLYGDFKSGGAAEWFTYNRDSIRHVTIEMAGGRNIAADVTPMTWGDAGYVDMEWVIEQNPEIIVRYYLPYLGTSMGIWWSYGIDDPTEMITKRDEVLNRPEFANVAAVKDERVQILAVDIISYGAPCISIAYFAKTFHPELFEDLDPQKVHQEFLTRFQRIDYDLDEHGVFAYPPLE